MLSVIKKVFRLLLMKHDENSPEYWEEYGVKIGNNVHVLNSKIDKGYGYLIEIGNNVTITGATILAHDASIKKFLGYTKIGKVIIGNDVFIGTGAIVLPNVIIGDNVIVGAGAVVRDSIPSNSVVTGNPATIVCTTEEYIEKNRERMKASHLYISENSIRTKEEKMKIRDEIGDKIGYDL